MGEGVDALLSLASLAHATSNSCAKEEDEAAAAEQEHEGGAHDDEEAEAATARRAAKAASSKATTPGEAKAQDVQLHCALKLLICSDAWHSQLRLRLMFLGTCHM